MVSERESIHVSVLGAHEALGRWHQRREDWDGVIACARRQIELEPWREAAYRQWMTALAMRGQRATALAQYEACRRVLLEELGVAPEVATEQLKNDIRDGAIGPAGDVAASTPAPGAEADLPANRHWSGKAAAAGEVPAVMPLAELVSSDGEWRRVTVLASEIMRSETLRESVGFEDWVWCLSELLRVVGAALRSLGGHLDRYDEDSLVGMFGAVQAHEDDVERAVVAALTMQEVFETQLSELARQQPQWRDGLLDLDLRTAVDVGEAIVTRIDDAGGGGRISVAGDVTRCVARLLDRVSPGAVGVSEDVQRLVAPLFHWARVPDGDGPGHFGPVRSKVQVGKGRGIAGMRSALVGRAAEAQAFRSRVERLGSGQGGIVTLVGEAGIGKSRLVAECRASTSGMARWVEGRCLSYSDSSVYSLWASTLRALIGVPDNAAADVMERALRRTLRSLVPDDPDASRPYLAHLLGLPQEASVEAMLAGMDAQARQNAIAYAVRRVLRAAAKVQPLVVVCEDLLWADASSLALLDRLLSLTEEAPVLFVCVMRPLPGHGSWGIRDTARETYSVRHAGIELDPLTLREGEVLLENLLLSIPGPEGRETVDALPTELKAAILSRGTALTRGMRWWSFRWHTVVWGSMVQPARGVWRPPRS